MTACCCSALALCWYLPKAANSAAAEPDRYVSRCMLPDAKQVLLPLGGHQEVWQGVRALARAKLSEEPPAFLTPAPKGEVEKLPQAVFLDEFFLLWVRCLVRHPALSRPTQQTNTRRHSARIMSLIQSFLVLYKLTRHMFLLMSRDVPN